MNTRGSAGLVVPENLQTQVDTLRTNRAIEPNDELRHIFSPPPAEGAMVAAFDVIHTS